MQNIKYKQLSEKINKYLIPIKQKISNRKLKKEKDENFNVNKFLELSNIEEKQLNIIED